MKTEEVYLKDCRMCDKYCKGGCHSVAQCINGELFRRDPTVVNLWKNGVSGVLK